MAKLFTLLEFALHTRAIERDLDHACQTLVEVAAHYCQSEAKAAIGTYTFNWPRLGPAAIRKHGDTPLLDTGALRDSIELTIGKFEAWVGTNNPHAAFQEFGTGRIPPRPFLGPTIYGAEEVVKQAAKKLIPQALKGHGMHGAGVHELLEILHIIRDIYKEVKAVGKEFMK